MPSSSRSWHACRCVVLRRSRALLLGVNREGRPDAVVLNESNCSVEHVLPTGEEHWKGWKEFGEVDPGEWVHRVGNLTLTAKGDNKPGGKFNGSFAKKAEVYGDTSVAITREIAGRTSWSPTDIEDRQRKNREARGSRLVFHVTVEVDAPRRVAKNGLGGVGISARIPAGGDIPDYCINRGMLL